MHITIEPGDMTRYEFLVERDGDRCFIAGYPRFDLYSYKISEAKRIYDTYPDFSASNTPTYKWMSDGYIQYMCEHSNCNPWTARAALMVIRDLM